MGFFDLKATCVICENEVGLNRNKTKQGWICRNCMNLLAKKSINVLNISKYDLDELKKVVAEDNCNFIKNAKDEEIKKDVRLEETVSEEPSTSEIVRGDTINNHDDILYCNNCGKKILGKSKFCQHCGSKINTGIELKEAKNIIDSVSNAISMNVKPTIQNTISYNIRNKFCCPKCKGNNIDLVSTDKNMKETHKTSVNLNPLRPFTVYNTKTVVKEKKSASKIGLGVMTGGASLLVTGVHNKKHCEYFCRECGNRWVDK